MPINTVNFDGESSIEKMLSIVERFQPGIRGRFESRRQIDAAFAEASLRYAARLFGRTTLDTRTRLLVMIGQYTMSRRHPRLRETIIAACEQRLDLREVLEVMFQCSIYGGESIVDEPLSIFTEELNARGLLDEVATRSLRTGQRETERSLEDERKTWHPEDSADPRADELMSKYGWPGISIALALRPRHTLNNATFIGGLDEAFAEAFYDFGYSDMYGRQILDHKTRLLCMVGNTLAIGEIVQTRHHMRTAMKQGASPREVLEVLFQSVVVVGHPNIVPERFRDLVNIIEEETGAGL
ncbi:carboxymuconolactone decarboxylase family protein [Rhizobium sp. BK060]|uniref:carboxymuconolactone decarboxylase family protein n=1 Tax=Rhizobium sp. BK060 TaxID=2587096 RepID=UPI00160F7D9D|nr:carboxymuconolactone decarboxylase family protein [Rhizobium sp. BK060]MBB3396180.1 alkylhydroperoxidase/carboxymuconolactone decarboxylase family protein YurZ [Rhizobium sp. BK060]